MVLCNLFNASSASNISFITFDDGFEFRKLTFVSISFDWDGSGDGRGKEDGPIESQEDGPSESNIF